MTLENFWQLIKEARDSVEKASEIAGCLEAKLIQLPESEIVDFGRHFSTCLRLSYDARLWLAASVIKGGCGDDSFMDFRGWLISHGQKVFEAALADPDSLAELELKDFDGNYNQDPRMEAILYVTSKAFCFRTCQDRDNVEAIQRYHSMLPKWIQPVLANKEFMKLSDGEAMQLFPKLAARFPEGIGAIGRKVEPPVFPPCD